MCRKFNLFILSMLLTMIFSGMFVFAVSFAEKAESIEDAFRNGKVEGVMGSYLNSQMQMPSIQILAGALTT